MLDSQDPDRPAKATGPWGVQVIGKSRSRNVESMTIMGGVAEPEITAAEVRILLIWREQMVDATRAAMDALESVGCDPTETLARLHDAVDRGPGLLPLPRDEAA